MPLEMFVQVRDVDHQSLLRGWECPGADTGCRKSGTPSVRLGKPVVCYAVVPSEALPWWPYGSERVEPGVLCDLNTIE